MRMTREALWMAAVGLLFGLVFMLGGCTFAALAAAAW